MESLSCLDRTFQASGGRLYCVKGDTVPTLKALIKVRDGGFSSLRVYLCSLCNKEGQSIKYVVL